MAHVALGVLDPSSYNSRNEGLQSEARPCHDTGGVAHVPLGVLDLLRIHLRHLDPHIADLFKRLAVLVLGGVCVRLLLALSPLAIESDEGK